MRRRNQRGGRNREIATLLAVGEGAADAAFVKHMKGIYDDRESGQRISVESADGGSPLAMVKLIAKRHQHASFDRKFLLIDSDIEIPKEARDLAETAGLELIISEPHCLEGMLLEVLGKPAGFDSTDCKERLHPMLSGPETSKESYADRFPKGVLDSAQKKQIVRLRQLLSNE